jgi:hypothetical protein
VAILDVGTGNGNFAIYLASQGFQVLTGEPSTDRSHYAGRDWALNAKKAGSWTKFALRLSMRATCRLSQKPLMRSSSSAFSIMSVNISEATCSAKRCGSQNSTERLSFLSLEWKRFRYFGLMIQATRSQRTLEHRIEGSFMDIFIYKKAM